MKRKHFLIVRPDRLGDVVLSTPIPREIKKTFPDASISILVRNYTESIFENNPHIDNVILFENFQSSGIRGFLKDSAKLRKYKFTHALMLLPNERLNYLLFFAGIPSRYGSGHKFYQFITGAKAVSRKKYIPLRHEADYCMDLARRVEVDGSDLSTEIFLNEKQKKLSENLRFELLKGKKYLVGIHSTSGNSAPNWKPEIYKILIDKLLHQKDISVIVTDNEVPEVLKNIDRVLYPNVNSKLSESFPIFNAVDLLVSASTGPMHIAAALKTKTVALFCPMTACSPKLWGPMGNEAETILPEEQFCKTQCPEDPKKCSFKGEEGISTDKIIESILEMIKK